MVRRFYKALFDYDGSTGSNMIPMTAGDIVYSDEEQTNSDWYNVTKLTDGSTGLVPANYLKEISAEEAGLVGRNRSAGLLGMGGSNEDDSQGTGPTPSLGVKDLTSSISPGGSGPQNPVAPPPPTGLGGSINANNPPMIPGGAQNYNSTTDALPASFADMFQRHDAYFRQVVRQREESFKKLEAALSAASKDISACKEKNAKLTQRITELDSLIEEERRKWRERLEAEKRSLFRGTQ